MYKSACTTQIHIHGSAVFMLSGVSIGSVFLEMSMFLKIRSICIFKVWKLNWLKILLYLTFNFDTIEENSLFCC